jgi:hypothetical protein
VSNTIKCDGIEDLQQHDLISFFLSSKNRKTEQHDLIKREGNCYYLVGVLDEREIERETDRPRSVVTVL